MTAVAIAGKAHSSSATDAQTYAAFSTSPSQDRTAGRLYLVVASATFGSAYAGTPTLTGPAGETWVLGASRRWSSDTRFIGIFHYFADAGTSGAITVDYGTTALNNRMVLLEVTETVARSPILQTKAHEVAAASTDPNSLTFDPLQSETATLVVLAATGSLGSWTLDGDYATLYALDVGDGVNTQKSVTHVWDNQGETTYDASFSFTSAARIVFGVEIAKVDASGWQVGSVAIG